MDRKVQRKKEYNRINKRYNNGINTAIRYLAYCKKEYAIENIRDRMTALYKFTSILSYINAEAPWYFKEIHNIDKLSTPLFEDIFPL